MEIGWFGFLLLMAVFFAGCWIGSFQARRKDLNELIKRISDAQTVEKLNQLADELHRLVKGENKKTLDQISRLFGRLVVLDRTGTDVAFVLAALGVTAGIVASAASDWIDQKSGPSFSLLSFGRGILIAVIAVGLIGLIFWFLRWLYKRLSKSAREIAAADDATVAAAVKLLEDAAKSSGPLKA